MNFLMIFLLRFYICLCCKIKSVIQFLVPFFYFIEDIGNFFLWNMRNSIITRNLLLLILAILINVLIEFIFQLLQYYLSVYWHKLTKYLSTKSFYDICLLPKMYLLLNSQISSNKLRYVLSSIASHSSVIKLNCSMNLSR